MHLPKSSLTRRSFTSLAFVSLALTLAIPSHAEIDKKKADEKARTEAVGELGGEGAEKFDKLHGKLKDDGEQNLREIHELMKQIQGDLANRKTGEPIQKRQTTLIEKIEELIQKMIEQTQQGQGSSSQQQNQKPKGGGSKQDQKQSGQQRENKRDPKMKPGQQKQDQKQGEQKKSENEKYGPTKHDRKSEGKLPPAKPRTLHDVLRSKKQWGLLPDKLQVIVGSSTGKEFPSEYRELISSYFKRLSDVLLEEDK